MSALKELIQDSLNTKRLHPLLLTPSEQVLEVLDLKIVIVGCKKIPLLEKIDIIINWIDSNTTSTLKLYYKEKSVSLKKKELAKVASKIDSPMKVVSKFRYFDDKFKQWYEKHGGKEIALSYILKSDSEFLCCADNVNELWDIPQTYRRLLLENKRFHYTQKSLSKYQIYIIANDALTYFQSFLQKKIGSLQSWNC